ncbi:MAG: sigma-70 family RNA polymerase sigma factor, partial [Clostridia bacterium]|nr:sigma-70 family RNA polymerase sigma factor [Clostridia bacterium]
VDMLGGEGIEDNVINKVLVDEILSVLSKREREVIIFRYFRGKTQSEIAKYIGVSQVQVSRIEKKALERIRSSVGV